MKKTFKYVVIEEVENGFRLGARFTPQEIKHYVFETDQKLIQWLEPYLKNELEVNKEDETHEEMA